jgi:endonuclease-8
VPEGDVVLRTARRLHAALAGRRLITSDLRWPSLATVDLTGREVLEVVARGKHLLIRVDAGPLDPANTGPAGASTGPTQTGADTARAGTGLTLHSHLRMEGSWHVHRTGEPWRGARPEHGIRAILANTEWTAIGHRLGMLDLVATDQEHTLIGHLGPDILSPNWDLDAAVARIVAEPERPIGEALLDQRVIAGIGTFYLAESCFLRGVNPWQPVREVTDLAALVRMAHRLMTANLERAVQVTTGDARRGQEQWVHARSGRPCRRCRTTIRVAPLGAAPTQRVAFWCPSCQPGFVPTDTGAPQRPLGARPPSTTGTATTRPSPTTARYRRP